MDAERAALLGRDASELFRVFEIVGGAESHGVREYSRTEHARRKHAALKVACDQQREFGFLLKMVKQCDGGVTIVALAKVPLGRNRHSQRPDVILANAVAQAQIFGTAITKQLDAHANHEELADFLFKGKGVQGILRPDVAFARAP